MKTDFGFHIPGVKGIFDYNEIDRRTKLPHSHKDHLRIPREVEVKDMKQGHIEGRVPWALIVGSIKFR